MSTSSCSFSRLTNIAERNGLLSRVSITLQIVLFTSCLGAVASGLLFS